MSNPVPNQALASTPWSRRDLLGRLGCGFGALALSSLASDWQAWPQANAADLLTNPMAPRAPHFPAKAKRVIFFFLNGGPSQVDTFDPKPMLEKYAGKELPTPNLRTERKTGAAYPSPFTFAKYGQSGIEVSEIFAKTAAHIDDIAVIRSMHANVPNHEPSLMLMNCGDQTLVRPSMGSWITYGMGTENQNLPGFIAMCPNGLPITGTQNWRSAFLPGIFQGTHIDTQHRSIEKLIENIRNHTVSSIDQRRQLDLLQKLNRTHLTERGGQDASLDARIQSFEVAYRMQMEATDAFNIEQEPEHVQKAYGESVQGRQTLIARRLIERGVRFVQLWHGEGQPWDNHDEIGKNHRRLAGEVDGAIAALITDLKQRGLFEETLIIIGGEFGRTPVVELPTDGANAGTLSGRDHNHYGFTYLLAGGGVRGGYVHGATDEFGFQAVENKVHVHDLQATILHLLGFDHERLTYRYAGRDFRLTDVHGHVVKELLA